METGASSSSAPPPAAWLVAPDGQQWPLTGDVLTCGRSGDNHLVLGIQAVGHGVSELSASFSLAIEMGARLEDIAGTIHAHPTQSEAFQESALKALGHALHI